MCGTVHQQDSTLTAIMKGTYQELTLQAALLFPPADTPQPQRHSWYPPTHVAPIAIEASKKVSTESPCQPFFSLRTL
jgi:hypothetical protein